MLKESTPIHCVFAEYKINIDLGEGGSEISLLQIFLKIAKCPKNFGQDCTFRQEKRVYCRYRHRGKTCAHL